MSKLSAAERIEKSGIVGIIRAPDGGQIVDKIAQALLAGGVDVLEVTFTVPRAHKVLEQVADALGDKVLLGCRNGARYRNVSHGNPGRGRVHRLARHERRRHPDVPPIFQARFGPER